MSLALPNSVDAVIELLAAQNYVCDRPLATALFLSLKLQRPLLLEGAPGVGKTELAKSLARALNTLLLRVQCYEGLDVAQTAYEWNVARQMIEIRLAEAVHDTDRERLTHSLYSRPMLIERPLLQALTQPRSPVCFSPPWACRCSPSVYGASVPATASISGSRWPHSPGRCSAATISSAIFPCPRQRGSG